MVFLSKTQKILNLGKIRKYDGVFFSKRISFHLFKSLLYKNEKAKNMPVVAVRLVDNYFVPQSCVLLLVMKT